MTVIRRTPMRHELKAPEGMYRVVAGEKRVVADYPDRVQALKVAKSVKEGWVADSEGNRIES
ncbi:MAG: hypothetical protein JWN64_318 [Parcubacteria group bacterium]|nr:hypothetical protein [Parcubacteria group bacterium]